MGLLADGQSTSSLCCPASIYLTYLHQLACCKLTLSTAARPIAPTLKRQSSRHGPSTAAELGDSTGVSPQFPGFNDATKGQALQQQSPSKQVSLPSASDTSDSPAFRMFKCGTCQFEATTKCHLKEHMMKHSGKLLSLNFSSIWLSGPIHG